MTGMTRDEPRFSDDEIIELARSLEPHDHERIRPPAEVWNNILAELEEEIGASEAAARQRHRSRWTSPRVLTIAAAVVLVVGIIAGVAAISGDDLETREVAAAVMTDDGLPVATTATADARIVCEGDDCAVEVDLSAIPDADNADLELWVINADVTDMHSLGLVTESGVFELPQGVTAEDFPIVDISVEPRDGVPTHSGQSVLRGVFEPV